MLVEPFRRRKDLGPILQREGMRRGAEVGADDSETPPCLRLLQCVQDKPVNQVRGYSYEH